MYLNTKDSHNLNQSKNFKFVRSSTPDGKGDKNKQIFGNIDVHRSYEEIENKLYQIKDNDEKSNIADYILPEDEKNLILNSENDKKNSIKKTMIKSKKEIQNFLSQLKVSYNMEDETFQEKLPFQKKNNLKKVETNSGILNPRENNIDISNYCSPKKQFIVADSQDNHRKSKTMLEITNLKDIKNGVEKNNFILDKQSSERSFDNSGLNNLIDSYNNFLNFDNISSKPLKLDNDQTNNNNRRITKSSNISNENKSSLFSKNLKEIMHSDSNPVYNNYLGNDAPKEYDGSRPLHKFNNVYDSYSDEELDETYEDNKMFMIDPNSSFKVIWDISLLLSIIYSAIFSPFFIAFNFDENFDLIFYLEALIDLLFIIDVVLNFLIPYYDHEENLVWNFSKIRNKYLQSWFLLDIISSYPSYLISIISGGIHLNTYFSVLDFSNIYRFMKWIRMTKFSKFGKAHFIEVIFPNFSVSNNDGVNRAIKFSIFLIVLVHISSCFWIFLGRANFDRTWITNANLQNSNFMDIYTASLYFNLVTIFSIGYGDILSTNIAEKFYNSLYMIVGTFLFSFTISCFSTIFGKMDEKKMLIKRKLEMLHKFQSEFVIPNELLSKIRKTIKHQIKKSNTDKYKLLDELTNNLKNELNLIMNKENIKNFYFFKNKPHDFIIFVIPLLKSIISAKGEPLFSEGEYVEEMFFVVKGRLSIQLGQLYDHINLAHILRNQHFGEILMYTNQHSPYNLLVKTNVSEILTLKKSDFSKVKISFYEIISELLAESYVFLEQIEKRKNVIHLLYSYDNSLSEIRKMIMKLNNYILEKDFDKFYYQDNSFGDAMEILENDHSEDLKQLIFKGKNFKNKKLTDINHNFLEKIANEKKIASEESKNDLPVVIEKRKKGSIPARRRYSYSHRKNLTQLYDGNNPLNLGTFEKKNSNKNNQESADNRKLLYLTNTFKEKIINESRKSSKELKENPLNNNNKNNNHGETITPTNNQININLYNYESNLNQKFIIYQNKNDDIFKTNVTDMNKQINPKNQSKVLEDSFNNNMSFKDNSNTIELIYKDTLNEKDLHDNEESKEEDNFVSNFQLNPPKFFSDLSKEKDNLTEKNVKPQRPSLSKNKSKLFLNCSYRESQTKNHAAKF